jgi:hypothetical protein
LEQGESGCTLYVLKSVGNEDAGLNPAARHIETFSNRLSVIQGILLYFSNGSTEAVGWGRGWDGVSDCSFSDDEPKSFLRKFMGCGRGQE